MEPNGASRWEGSCNLLISWSGRRDSNPRRPAWEAGILPLNYSRFGLRPASLYHRPAGARSRFPNPRDIDFTERLACTRTAPHARRCEALALIGRVPHAIFVTCHAVTDQDRDRARRQHEASKSDVGPETQRSDCNHHASVDELTGGCPAASLGVRLIPGTIFCGALRLRRPVLHLPRVLRHIREDRTPGKTLHSFSRLSIRPDSFRTL